VIEPGAGRGDRWLIYGAEGYSGRLIAERARAEGLTPVLAGRSEEVRALGGRLGLRAEVYGLDDADELARRIAGYTAVLHCAGPFSATSRPMVDACLRSGVHQLDVTGEPAVLQAVYARDEEARRRGVVLLPGAGCAVVVADCLALTLCERMPDAVRLEIAFASTSRSSRGSLATMIEAIPQGGMVVDRAALVRVPLASRARRVAFADRTLPAVSIAWGDIVSAHRTTGIAEITVYLAAPWSVFVGLQAIRPFARLIGRTAVQRFLTRQLRRAPIGPSEVSRRSARTWYWAAAENAKGQRIAAQVDLPDVYDLTTSAALAAMHQVLGGRVAPGAWTPAKAFGAGFVTRLPDTHLRMLS
jgi:short subunit dehydrogenase-like uncharacterized protein